MPIRRRDLLCLTGATAALGALAPLRAKAEAQGSGDFSPMWAGQAASLGRALPAGELTRTLAAEALERMRGLARDASNL